MKKTIDYPPTCFERLEKAERTLKSLDKMIKLIKKYPIKSGKRLPPMPYTIESFNYCMNSPQD